MAWLARDSAADHLLVAGLAGECGLLGAYQRAGRTGESSELRGPCGGRSAFAGDGVTLLFAAIRDLRAWLGDEATGLSGPRALNRLVRGVLAGLTPLGVAASYPGRDFVAAAGERVAQLSLSRSDEGACLFQAVLARDRRFTTAEPAPQFPGLPPLPPAGVLRVDAESLAAGLVRGFASRFGLEVEPAVESLEREREIAATRPLPLADPELAGLRAGRPAATPIGELVAHVALRSDGALERVRLRGDWIAPPGAVRALEESLVGLAPGSDGVRELCARWLANPASWVVGVTDGAAIAGAVADAAAGHSA